MMTLVIKDVSLRMTTNTEQDNSIEPFDFSTLNAMATCNKWGAIRYGEKRTMCLADRELPLEAGGLCHEVFAMLRLLNAKQQGHTFDILSEVTRVLDKTDVDRATKITKAITLESPQEIIETVVDTSGYYNDPEDKKRTVENIKEALYLYAIKFMDYCIDHPVYVSEDGSMIGTEHSFDIVCLFTYIKDGVEDTLPVRFIGKIDGIHHNTHTKRLEVHENKTASRIDDVWLSQWITSHQITGYCLAAQTLLGIPCNDARVLGLQLPIPVRTPMLGFRVEAVNRQDYMFNNWAKWFVHNVLLYKDLKGKPQEAIMNTHECTRYFRSCMMIPICTLPEEEQFETIQELPISTWSPLGKDE